jgi:subtilisin-like proprotein convertase family protein
MNSLTSCYCNSGATNTADDDIGAITFGALSNGIGTPAINNGASTNLYTDFTALPPQSFIQTYSYPLSITQINSGGFYACWASAFIDFNQDGDFNDANERVFDAGTTAAIGGNVVSGTVTIPLNAIPGNTRLRIILAEQGTIAQTSCATYTWGETEDYTITLLPIAPCTAPPIGGQTVSTLPTVCPHAPFTLSLTGNSIGLGLTYQWFSSVNGTVWNTIAGAFSSSYAGSQLSATYYRCSLTCAGSTDYSTTLLVPMQAGSASFSTTAPGLIPDNNTAVCFPISVSGLGSVIDTLFGLTEVCINIQHPEVGELKVFLKSPAGDTVYLSENNGGLFANYDNTCFAMNGANGYIYAANAPFTGTFIPNQSINNFNDGQNPNGIWYLCVKDEAPSVLPAGQFLSATLSFCTNPPRNPIIPVGGCTGTNAFGCQCPDGTQNCDLLPDMTASALIIQNDHPESLGSMRLSNATPNIGWGPIEIHGSNQCFCDTVPVPCTTTICPGGLPVKEVVKQTIYHKNNGVMTSTTRDAGFMSFHPSHGHVHVDSWGAFSLRVPTSNPDATTWPIVGTGAKVSFCLINLGNCTNNLGYCEDNAGNVITQADIPNSGFGNVTGCGRDQGIFTGSLDIYSSGLAGMQIDFPGTCNGNYAIVSITDPNNNFLEQDETNNWVQVPVTLTQQFPPSGVTSFAYSTAGNTISFTNTTPLANGYLWDFGDGTTDTTKNPIHTYAGNGPYIVKLMALNHCYTATTQNILITGIKENENFALGFNAHPNPTNGNVHLSYFIPQRGKVVIELFNLVGEKVSTINNQVMENGLQQLDYNFKERGLESGSYLIKISIEGKSQTLRIVVL